MASIGTYISDKELREPYKGLGEEKLINILIRKHKEIRKLTPNNTFEEYLLIMEKEQQTLN